MQVCLRTGVEASACTHAQALICVVVNSSGPSPTATGARCGEAMDVRCVAGARAHRSRGAQAEALESVAAKDEGWGLGSRDGGMGDGGRGRGRGAGERRGAPTTGRLVRGDARQPPMHERRVCTAKKRNALVRSWAHTAAPMLASGFEARVGADVSRVFEPPGRHAAATAAAAADKEAQAA
eukprot:366097-Chlamydomonas_euryale.AAC.5